MKASFFVAMGIMAGVWVTMMYYGHREYGRDKSHKAEVELLCDSIADMNARHLQQERLCHGKLREVVERCFRYGNCRD